MLVLWGAAFLWYRGEGDGISFRWRGFRGGHFDDLFVEFVYGWELIWLPGCFRRASRVGWR